MILIAFLSLLASLPTSVAEDVEPLDMWIAALKSKVDSKREEAARELGFYDSTRAVDALICALRNDSNDGVRNNAIVSLGMLGPTAKKAIPLLIGILEDKATYSPFADIVRATDPNHLAARALAAIGPDAVIPLVEVAEDKNLDISIRRLAMTAVSLAEAKSRDVEVRIIPLLTDEEEDIRLDTLFALAQLAPKSTAVKRAVLGALADSSEYVRVVAAATLYEIDPKNVITVPLLVEHAEKGNERIQWRAITELGMLGSKAQAAVPVLVKFLKSDDPDLRIAAIRALGRIGPDAKDAVPALRESLKDPNQSARINAFDSLNNITRKKPK